MTVREVKPQDSEAILGLMRQMGTRYFEESSFEGLFFQVLSDPATELQAVVLNGEMVGFVSLRYHLALSHGLSVQIEELVVGERWRGQGIGSTLMGWLVKRAKDMNCRMIEVGCAYHRRQAHDFYKKHDFEDTGGRFQRSL